KPMEENLKKTGIELSTFVPVHFGYKGRDEIDYPVSNYVNVSYCYNKRDRAFFYLKHHKIKKELLNNYNIKKFDILHAHSLFSNGYIAYTAYKKHKIPYVVAVRST